MYNVVGVQGKRLISTLHSVPVFVIVVLLFWLVHGNVLSGYQMLVYVHYVCHPDLIV